MRIHVLLLMVSIAALGCEASVGGGRDAGSGGGLDAGGAVDGALPPGTDAGPGSADAGPPLAEGAPREEICGNEVDDDDDGMIDDGCDCAVGTERPCWLGPPDARGVGVCHDGVQRCQSAGATATWSYCEDETLPSREVLGTGFDEDCDGTIDEPDGICVATTQNETGADCGNGRDDDCDTVIDCDDPSCVGEARCPGGCEATELLCWGGYDDDCDGQLDCADSDCAGHPACSTAGTCPAGQVPTYRERALGASYGGSFIARGDGQPMMPRACEPGSCAAGQVQVIRQGLMPICVPPPPECPEGTSPNYRASGMWRCDPPCDLIIHYGSIFGGRNVCAGIPDITCPSGQVPTFVEETETWQCRATCNNGLYDRINLDGMLVCVPC